MNSLKYLNSVLTLIALLLLAILFQQSSDTQGRNGLELVTPLHAQVTETGDGFLFYPVGNQQIRRFVFFDAKNNVIYDYNSGGKLDKTWVLSALGSNLEKR